MKLQVVLLAMAMLIASTFAEPAIEERKLNEQEPPTDDSDKVEANSFPLSIGDPNSDVVVPEGFEKDGRSEMEDFVTAMSSDVLDDSEMDDKDGKTLCFWPYVYGGYGRCCYNTHPYYYSGYCNRCRLGYVYSRGSCCPKTHPNYISGTGKCCRSGYNYYYSGYCRKCPSSYPNYYNGRCYKNCSTGCFRGGWCSIFYCFGR